MLTVRQHIMYLLIAASQYVRTFDGLDLLYIQPCMQAYKVLRIHQGNAALAAATNSCTCSALYRHACKYWPPYMDRQALSSLHQF